MKQQKVLGIVAKELGKASEKKSSGRIKVVAFYSEDILIKEQSKIINQFRPHGYVFAPSFDFNKFKFGTLIEFYTSLNTISINNFDHDQIILDSKYEVKKTGIPLFEINENIFSNDYSIDPNKINYNLISSELYIFYIKNQNFLYGPFKAEDEVIRPQKGKEVAKYNFDLKDCFGYDGHYYLLSSPKVEVCKIDCMTNDQIADWVKDKMKLVSLNLKIKELKGAFQSLEVFDLEKARLLRANDCLDNIILNLNEFNQWASISESFKEILIRKLSDIDKKLEDERIKPLQSAILELDENIKDKMRKDAKLENEMHKKKILLETTQKQFNEISQEKERIIKDIRILSQIASFDSENNSLLTYHSEKFVKKQIHFENLDEYILEFNQSINEENEETKNLGKKLVYQLCKNRIFLSKNIELIIQLARLSNNCNLVIQQVEPDWLKFENLYFNGLKYTWEAATYESDEFYFLILQDSNMSSIECYAKPILDINWGIRSTLPKLNTTWPENLKIFLSPLNIDLNHQGLGLPLVKNTYSKNWGAFPIIKSDLSFTTKSSDKFLPIGMLRGDNHININNLDEYFPNGY